MKTVLFSLLMLITFSAFGQYEYVEIRYPKGEWKIIYGVIPEIDTANVINFTAYLYMSESKRSKKLAKKRMDRLMKVYKINKPKYIVRIPRMGNEEEEEGLVRIYYSLPQKRA